MLSLAWSELSIRHGGSAVPGSTPLSAAAALACSDSVLLLPEVASAAECDEVVQACSQALELGQRLVRLPSIAAAAGAEQDVSWTWAPGFDGDPPAGAPLSQIPAGADAICDVILRRVIAVVDRELGPVVVSQFGTTSLSELLAAGELEFASREPAVNVYAEGGNFPPHEDHQVQVDPLLDLPTTTSDCDLSCDLRTVTLIWTTDPDPNSDPHPDQALTVLVPLSEHGGGGTGFWPSDDEQHAQSAPPLAVPQPAPCTSSRRAWRLCAAQHSQGEAQPLGAQPPPRGLERAASKVAHLTAFDHRL